METYFAHKVRSVHRYTSSTTNSIKREENVKKHDNKLQTE